MNWSSKKAKKRKAFPSSTREEAFVTHSKILLMALVALFLAACNSRTEKERTDPLTNEGWFSSIKRTIIEPKCISCHLGAGAAMGIDLSSYSKVMESNSVVPYKPELSRFFTTIESGKMPKGGQRLSDPEIQKVYDWISKGAPEGTLPDPTPTPDPIPQPTLASIQKNYVDKRCVSCHQEATHSNRHVKLTNLIEVIEGTGPTGHVRKIIKPGCPKESFFHSIMREAKMPPPPGEKPPQEWLKVMADWITSLKPGAICDDEPGGDSDND